MKKLLATSLFLFCILNLSACSNFQFPGAHKIDIMQGNIIKESDLAKLKIGMNKDQVRYILGSPLAENSLRSNTWIYIHSHKKGNKQVSKQRIDLNFDEKSKLIKIDQNKAAK